MNLLQMVPLDEAGMFKVLQMVNDSGTEKPLKDDVLKRAFNKWWPDLRDELAKMKVPQKQPEKSDRPVEGMLDEILTLVRSIDKVTNRQLALSDILSSTRWSAPSVYSARSFRNRETRSRGSCTETEIGIGSTKDRQWFSSSSL